MLSPIEKDYAVWRLESEAGQTEAKETIGTLQSFLMALKDVRVSDFSAIEVKCSS